MVERGQDLTISENSAELSKAEIMVDVIVRRIKRAKQNHVRDFLFESNELKSKYYFGDGQRFYQIDANPYNGVVDEIKESLKLKLKGEAALTRTGELEQRYTTNQVRLEIVEKYSFLDPTGENIRVSAWYAEGVERERFGPFKIPRFLRESY